MPGTLALRATGPEDLDRIQAFLCSVFHLDAPAPGFRADAMRWKYFDPHPFWDGSRSYVLEAGGEIAAHGCVVPIRFLTQAGPVTSCCIIDWAANPNVPGAGALLYQRLYRMRETMLGIGGSDAARKVLPRMGFRVCAELHNFVRVVRPFDSFQASPGIKWKSAAHLSRNVARLFRPVAPVPSGWSATSVTQFDESILPVLPRPVPGHGSSPEAVPERSAAFLNYVLACPVAKTTAFAFRHEGKLIGYCVLSHSGRQCRIADLWIVSDRPEDWRIAYGYGARLALENPAVSEVLASATQTRTKRAISGSGLYFRESMPVFLRDSKAKLDKISPENPEIRIGALENDFFYL